MPIEQIEKELKIIAESEFSRLFPHRRTTSSISAASKKILCQGRGSAANSAVCYALGITAVDAVRYHLLFERFLAPERDGPPDIDVDIESDRREEVIQYVYEQYGRDYAAQVANVNTFRPRMAVRDMAKALGHSPGQQDAYSKQLDGWAPLAAQVENARNGGGGIEHPIPADVLDLAAQIQDFPRHLGIHSGGMVICDRPVAQVCPVEWARMENRSVLQWDKDDCAAMGLVKFDLLGLGMLSALHYAVDLVREHEGIEVDFAQLDLEEPAVYEMLQRADSVGVFQVESRAQMATLPRLKPRTFYDLVVEVALIRPGPIQGGSVHPYIRRRNGLEPVTYDHPVMQRSLAKTLGIPLFQEQLMQLAVDVAGFDAGEADQLRRAMGAKRSSAKMEKLKSRLYDGMRSTARHHRRRRRPDLRTAAGVRQLRVRRVARAVLRRAGLLLVLAEAAPPGGVLRGAAPGPADGLLLAAVAGRRRPPARGHRPPARHQRLQGAGRSGTRTGRQTGGPAGAGRDPHHRHRARRADRRRPDRARRGYRTLDELTRAVTLTTAQAEALATAGALDALTGMARQGRHRPAARAVGGRCRRRSAGRHAAGHAGRPGGPAAARDERHRADRRRHLGDRDLPGVLSHRVLPASSSTSWGVRTATGPAPGRARHPGAGRRGGHPPAAAGHRVRGHLHQPRGRDRDGQRHLLDRAVVPVPADRPRVAVAADPRGGGTRRVGRSRSSPTGSPR